MQEQVFKALPLVSLEHIEPTHTAVSNEEIDAAVNRCRYQYQLFANIDRPSKTQVDARERWYSQLTRYRVEQNKRRSRSDTTHAKAMSVSVFGGVG